MYQIEVSQQGKIIRTERIPAASAQAAIALVEVEYPSQVVVLNGQRFEWRGVDFVARKLA